MQQNSFQKRKCWLIHSMKLNSNLQSFEIIEIIDTIYPISHWSWYNSEVSKRHSESVVEIAVRYKNSYLAK